MSTPRSQAWSAFQGHRLLISGAPVPTALAVKRAVADGASEPVLVFDDATGRVIDLDLRGSDDEIAQRLMSPAPGRRARSRPSAAPAPDDESGTESGAKGRGRPRLGVVSREVTLLPRHWNWLAAQRGGASAALRRLVEDARRQPDAEVGQRAAREAAYHFMQAIAGDLAGFEEASRALFADDRPALEKRLASWPADIGAYALRLAFAPPSTRSGEAESD